MMRFTVRLLMLAALVTVTLAAAQERGHRWASFRVGSWAELKTTAPGSDQVVKTRWTLLSVTSSEATVRLDIDREGETTSREVKFPIPEGASTADRVHREKVNFNGQTLSCRVSEYDERQTTVWECDEVPGFTYKTETPKSITTLVAFESK